MNMSNPFAWEYNFPPAYVQTSVSFLKRCTGFRNAKLGDMQSAMIVANACVNSRVITEIRQRYPNAVLLPVITDNKLPTALADIIGMDIHTGVYSVKTQSRKSLSAMERLLHKPVFSGEIAREKSYIIVDDIITQGGTVSAFRKYVIENGGYVVAIAALSCSAGSKVLVPSENDIFDISGRFRLHEINRILKFYDIAQDLSELTHAQIRYLLRFEKAERLINKIEETKMSIGQIKFAFS